MTTPILSLAYLFAKDALKVATINIGAPPGQSFGDRRISQQCEAFVPVERSQAVAEDNTVVER
jgi:hypothetical protein